jgi:hypothetical protein
MRQRFQSVGSEATGDVIRALFLQSRKRGLQPSLTRIHYSAGRVSALLNMPPQTLSVGQKKHLDAFLRFCPGAHKLRQFVLQFRAMLRWRSAKRLTTWIDSATVSGFRFTAQFARTLRRDLEAVKLSMTTPWSNGPIEGQINRLKAIKRQMYGRAGFENTILVRELGKEGDAAEPRSNCKRHVSQEDPEDYLLRQFLEKYYWHSFENCLMFGRYG